MYERLHLCVIVLNIVFVDGIYSNKSVGIEAILTDIHILLTDLPPFLQGDGLYTPKNIERNCKRMALKCFMKEVGVLKEENQDNKKITDTIDSIQRSIKNIWREDLQNINQENGCPRCETYKLEHSKVFLNKLTEFLQWAHYTGF